MGTGSTTVFASTKSQQLFVFKYLYRPIALLVVQLICDTWVLDPDSYVSTATPMPDSSLWRLRGLANLKGDRFRFIERNNAPYTKSTLEVNDRTLNTAHAR